MRVVWGFMLENTYFTEFDLVNHRIIEEAYHQRKTRQTSHYINIRDSHLPVQARVYFGVEQIHLRMPGTRYYVKRRVVTSSSSYSPSSMTRTPHHRPHRRIHSPATQANSNTPWPSYPLETSGPMVLASSPMCHDQSFGTSAMMLSQSNPYLSPPPPPPSQSMLMPPPHSQASPFQDYGGLCSSSSSSTCTSGSSTPGTLDVFSTVANQASQPLTSTNIFHLPSWHHVPSQSTPKSTVLGHLEMFNKSIPHSSWQQQQHNLLTDAVHHTHVTVGHSPAEMQPVCVNNDMIALSSMHVPWPLDDEMYGFGDPSYLISSSIQPF